MKTLEMPIYGGYKSNLACKPSSAGTLPMSLLELLLRLLCSLSKLAPSWPFNVLGSIGHLSFQVLSVNRMQAPFIAIMNHQYRWNNASMPIDNPIIAAWDSSNAIIIGL